MRRRAGALYIKDKNLFLMCEDDQGFFWTPGGGAENNETLEETLRRELHEELKAVLLRARPFMTIKDEVEDEAVTYFIVDVNLPERLPANISVKWYGRDDHEQNTIRISQRVYNKVFLKLMADGLV